MLPSAPMAISTLPHDRLPRKIHGAKSIPDEMDAYVLRFNPRTGALVFATRIGGRSYDGAWRVSLDRQGHAYVTGLTKSADFPTTADALQPDLRGNSDAFLVEVGPVGGSTLIGGSGDELGHGLDIDNAGAVYLGGVTSSSDFNGRQHAKASADDDAFLCRIRPAEPAASCLVFGGGKAEELTGVALDRNGGIYAVGVTNSADFPAIHPLQKSLRGTSDLFLTRLALPAMNMTFSTTFGGSGEDSGWGIAVDPRGNPVVAGITDSLDLPGTAGSYQPVNRGKKDAFVASARRGTSANPHFVALTSASVRNTVRSRPTSTSVTPAGFWTGCMAPWTIGLRGGTKRSRFTLG